MSLREYSRDYRFCSRGEVCERQRISDIHILEATDKTADPRLPISARVIDPCRAVKKFTRSGSSDLHKTYAPRSLSQLQATVQYLLRDIWWTTTSKIGLKGGDLSSVYTFVMDRLQAVRQDVISLDVFSSDQVAVIEMLRTMVYFYIHSMHLITSSYHRFGGQKPSSGVQQRNEVTARNGSRGSLSSGNSNSNTAPLIAVSSWFDLHSHDGALSSCLTTVISFCRQLHVGCQHPGSTFNVSVSCDELSAYSMLISTSRQLRNTFQSLCSSSSSNSSSSSSSSNSSHSVTRHVSAVAAMRVLCAQQPTLGSDAVHTMRESTADAGPSISRKYQTRQEISGTSSGQGHPARSASEMSQIALRCLSSIRQGNFDGAVKSFSPTAVNIPTTSVRSSSDIGSSSALPVRLTAPQRLMLAALLHSILPELRLCRLMLADLSDKKDELMDMASLARRLWLPPLFKSSDPESIVENDRRWMDMIDICEVLGVPVSSPANSPAQCTSSDFVVLKATLPATPTGGISEQIKQKEILDPDATMRLRSTLMGCHLDNLGSAATSVCAPTAWSAWGSDSAAVQSSSERQEQHEHQGVGVSAPADWSDLIETTFSSHTDSDSCSHNTVRGVLGANPSPSQPGDEESVRERKTCSVNAIGAIEVVRILREILHISHADDWFGCDVSP